MANILGLITDNGKEILEVDGVPSAAAGTPAPIGSMAMLDNAGVGEHYIKVGAADTAWDKIATSASSGINQGDFLQIPIYSTDATGYTVDDYVQQNSQDIDVRVEAQPARTVDIRYRIPNPGNTIAAADFILSEGAQIKNGNMTFNDNVVIGGNLTVNGALTYLNTTNTTITDKLITLNKGGAAASAGGSGLEFEENALITGYFKIAADRNGYELKAPNVAFKNDLDLSSLTADRIQNFADTSGTFVMRPNGTPGVTNQIAFWQDANNVISNAGLTFDPGTSTLTVTNLTVTNPPTISTLGLGVVHSSAAGLLSSSPVNLAGAATEITGILAIANGGTNSGTALNNNRIMYSSGGAIVEYPAMVPNQVYFGAVTTGLPAQSVNLWWDITNSRLGIGNAAPTRTLDVTGDSLFTGLLKVENSDANYEVRQASLSTTDATVTTGQTIAIPTDSEVLVESRVLGHRTGGASGAAGDAAAYVRTARFKNVAGTVTMHNLQTDYTSEDVAAYNSTMVASGTNAVIQVRGNTTTNVDWAITSMVQILS